VAQAQGPARSREVGFHEGPEVAHAGRRSHVEVEPAGIHRIGGARALVRLLAAFYRDGRGHEAVVGADGAEVADHDQARLAADPHGRVRPRDLEGPGELLGDVLYFELRLGDGLLRFLVPLRHRHLHGGGRGLVLLLIQPVLGGERELTRGRDLLLEGLDETALLLEATLLILQQLLLRLQELGQLLEGRRPGRAGHGLPRRRSLGRSRRGQRQHQSRHHRGGLPRAVE